MDYIFYTMTSLGSSYLVYRFLLKQQKTFQFNRFFLLGTLFLSLLAPILQFEWFETMPSITQISFEPSGIETVHHEAVDGIMVSNNHTSLHTILRILWYAYLMITLVLLIRFIKNLFDIMKRTRQDHAKLGQLKIINDNNAEQASSFFNYVFVNAEHIIEVKNSDPILQHESVHSRQYHTLDVLLVELLICVFWFNPFIWFYKKAMLQNHEFIADSCTVDSGVNIDNYSQIIINHSHKEHRVPLTSGFNFIQIKNRITMLHQTKSSVQSRILKVLLALVLFFGIFMFSSFKDIKEPLIVVVDAAHGGKDPGHLNEKDIVLSISNQLSQLSDDKIKIITLRTDDAFMSLKDRVKLVNAQQADLMLSLHCNTTEDVSIHGVEAYVSNENQNEKASLGYGWLLINEQLERQVVSEAKMKTANFYMLKHIECPGVLMELGFLSNVGDKSRLNDKEHQSQIVKALYNGLLEIRDKKELIHILNKE